MATLTRLKDGSVVPLPAQCILGRSTAAGIQIDETFASSEHCKLAWNGARWTIRDLGSRNGTFVDGKRVDAGAIATVQKGSGLGFGEPDATWRMDDDTPPGAVAVRLNDRHSVAAVNDLLILPDTDRPELSIYPDPNGPGWISEDGDGETSAVKDQGVVKAGGSIWRLDLPVISEATPMVDLTMTVDTVDLRFAVSRDEETVEITIILRGIETKLEPREHGYVLLTLARERAKDADAPLAERGWRRVADLERMLRADGNHINVAIHRARQQFAAAGMEAAAQIVGVKRGARRFGTDRFEIVALED